MNLVPFIPRPQATTSHRLATGHSQDQQGVRLQTPPVMTVTISTYAPVKRHTHRDIREATGHNANSELIKAYAPGCPKRNTRALGAEAVFSIAFVTLSTEPGGELCTQRGA